MRYLKSVRFWRALIPSLFFNFRHLPFHQAKKLPIWVYKMRCLSQKGSIIIDSERIYTGMIQLGFLQVATYPNNGITWRNKGKVIFKGRCKIGNDCYVIIGKQGKIIFGDGCRINAGSKIVSMCGISIGRNTLFGWGNIIIDSNFHNLYDMDKKKYKRVFSPIVIGDDNWFTSQCFVMPGVNTPERCIFGARSIVTRGGQYESYCVHGGSPIHVLSRNVMRDYDNDLVKDYTITEE